MRKLLLFAGLLFFFIACSPRYYQPQTVQYGSLPVGKEKLTPDSSVVRGLLPYAAEINKTMNNVIGDCAVQLEKNQEHNTLGYFMADAYRQQAAKVFGQQPDIAIMNYGGIRINSLGPGPITIGKVYELMPFDNVLVLLWLSGSQLQNLMDHLASRGGVPLSGGSYTVKNKKAEKLRIGNEPVDPAKKYLLATSDYMANGGDDCAMLISIAQMNKGYLQRDAIIDFVKELNAKGEKVTAAAEYRVTVER
jgi:2',3'-cyclic-nucleotide 2'-phosphodiesterase (5'-nucleotidase family)